MVISRTDFYLIYWTEREEERMNGIIDDQSKNMDLIVYGIILLLLVVVSIINLFLFFIVKDYSCLSVYH